MKEISIFYCREQLFSKDKLNFTYIQKTQSVDVVACSFFSLITVVCVLWKKIKIEKKYRSAKPVAFIKKNKNFVLFLRFLEYSSMYSLMTFSFSFFLLIYRNMCVHVYVCVSDLWRIESFFSFEI